MAKQPDPSKASWQFPGFFWAANGAELVERAAYYGVFIGLPIYLTQNYGFSDIGAGWLGAYFASGIYLLPTFTGATADRMGFRRALTLAFALLALGYGVLGGFGVPQVRAALGETGIQLGAVLGLSIVMVGGAFVKAVISGTVAVSSDAASRARAFSIFYAIVNVGAVLGKTVAKPLRVELGLQYVSFFSAAMALVGVGVVLLFYRGVERTGEPKSARETLDALLRVLRNGRFLSLIFIVAGFWVIQGQLYAAMPKYVLRLLGEGASPEWYANINPVVVVLLVIPITHLVRKIRPVTSIGIGLAIIPLTALAMAGAPALTDWVGPEVSFFGLLLHPVTVTMILGIALQGVAECFLSPRYLEFASKQAPKGEEGLTMGFSHLTTFFAWFFGFVLSGYLLDAFCPNPETLSPEAHAAWENAIEHGGSMPEAYAHAHYIWYVFAAIGVLSFLALLVFRWTTDRADKAA